MGSWCIPFLWRRQYEDCGLEILNSRLEGVHWIPEQLRKNRRIEAFLWLLSGRIPMFRSDFGNNHRGKTIKTSSPEDNLGRIPAPDDANRGGPARRFPALPVMTRRKPVLTLSAEPAQRGVRRFASKGAGA